MRGLGYLGEHGLAMLGDHGALVAVQRDEVVVEGLLGVLEHVVELCGPSFKDAAEVTGYQSPANCWSGKRRKITSVKPARPGEHVNRVPMAAPPAHAYMHSPITGQCLWEGVLELKLQGPQGPAPAPPLCCHSLYLFGPSSKQKVIVSMASSSKNSVVKASHHRLSHSWGQQRDAG